MNYDKSESQVLRRPVGFPCMICVQGAPLSPLATSGTLYDDATQADRTPAGSGTTKPWKEGPAHAYHGYRKCQQWTFIEYLMRSL